MHPPAYVLGTKLSEPLQKLLRRLDEPGVAHHGLEDDRSAGLGLQDLLHGGQVVVGGYSCTGGGACGDSGGVGEA